MIGPEDAGAVRQVSVRERDGFGDPAYCAVGAGQIDFGDEGVGAERSEFPGAIGNVRFQQRFGFSVAPSI